MNNIIILFISICLQMSFFATNATAQKIVYNTHTNRASRILETSQKKLGRIGEGNKKFYMWTSLASLDVKGVVIYSIKAMYTSEYHLTVTQGDPLTLTLKDGREIILKSAATVESQRLDGVETVFASYEIKEADLIDATRTGIVKVAPTVLCFGEKNYEKSISMWKLARPLSLRYDLLKDYIEKHPE